jgi:CxxC motif-containing protein
MTAGGLGVEGNRCPRGVEYARQEVVKPLRRVMSVVKVRNGDLPTLAVITRDPVPKECIWLVMEKLASLEVEAPVEVGDVILRDVCGTDIVATRRVRRVATSV